MSDTPDRVAVYPGSFDPITRGHEDLVYRTLRLTDRLIVAVAHTATQKKSSLFSVKDRVDLIKTVFANEPRVECTSFQGLLVDFCQEKGADLVVRGLRAVSDFEYEFQMALMNRKIHPEAETLFLAARENYSYVSSRILKEVFSLGGCVKDLAPPPVIEAMRQKFSETKGGPR
jgi:pantetheine-phosphate adenylyltransferase